MGLTEFAIFHAGISLQGIGSAPALVHPHVELAPGKGTLHSAEKDSDLVRLHRRIGGDQFIAVIHRVQIEKMVLLGINLATLVQLSAGDPDVIVFSRLCHHDQLMVFKVQTVDLAEGLHKGDNHCGRR